MSDLCMFPTTVGIFFSCKTPSYCHLQKYQYDLLLIFMETKKMAQEDYSESELIDRISMYIGPDSDQNSENFKILLKELVVELSALRFSRRTNYLLRHKTDDDGNHGIVFEKHMFDDNNQIRILSEDDATVAALFSTGKFLKNCDGETYSFVVHRDDKDIVITLAYSERELADIDEALLT